jgi:hypothetical protein
MLNPVVLPLPLAAAVIVVLAVVPVAYRLWLERFTRPTAVAENETGRHRLEGAAEPYRPRPWDELDAAVPIILDPLDSRMSLAEVEKLAVRFAETRQRAGYTMWSWSDDTHELERVA